MKSEELQKPLFYFIGIVALLSLLMIATRGSHFTAFNTLPSASIGVFFLAGMFLRTVKSYWFFYILSITIDLVSSYYRGSFGDCLTTAYPALAISYAVMFAFGYYAKPDWLKQNIVINIVKVGAALFLGSSIAFFISNGSFYALSGHFTDLSWAEYTSRVNKYYFNSISNPIFYATSAIVIDWGISRLYNHKVEAQLTS